MQKLPADTGRVWIKQGFALFRQQPAELATLFMSYMFLMFALGVIPVLGQILPLMLVPVFSMAFLQACAQIERKQRVYPNLLLTGFRSPALRSLLILGVLYMLAAALAVGASAIVDGGVLWQVVTEQLALDAKKVPGSNMKLAMLFAAAVYTPFAMAFWYAAPLVAWKNMGVGKALFYSFFAVFHAARAFLMYGLTWLMLGFLPGVVSIIFVMLGSTTLAVIAAMAAALVLTVVMYCSFYPSYTHIFGKPDADRADHAPPTIAGTE